MKSILIQSIILSFFVLALGCEKANKQSQENIKDMQNTIDQESYNQKGIYNAKAVRELTGLKWKFKAGSKIISSPIFNDGSIFFGNTRPNFYSINKRNGQENWKYSPKKYNGGTKVSPILSDDVIYFNSWNTLFEIDSKTGINISIHHYILNQNIFIDNEIFFLNTLGLFKYDLSTRTETNLCDFNLESGNSSLPVCNFDNSKIYFVNSNRVLYCYDIQNKILNSIFDPGPRKWRYCDKYSVKSSPIVLEDFVYYSGSDRNLYCINIKTNQEKWRYKTNGFIDSTPIAYKNTIYFGNDAGSMYAIDTSTGKLKWKFKTEGEIVSTPSIAENILYFGNTTGIFYAIDLTTGLELWNYNIGGSISSSALILDGLIVIGSEDGNIYALH